MKTIKQFVLIAILALAATGCLEDFTVHGNGISVSQGRPVAAFDKVKSSGDFEVHITKGNEYDVLVNAEETLQPYIETYVSGNTLHIDVEGWHNLKNRLPMKVYVTVPALTSIKQSGSGYITTAHFTAAKYELFVSGSGNISTSVDAGIVEAAVSGSGSIIISGNAGDTYYAISGSGGIDSYELETENCDANISGSGNMRVFATETLTAKISGSGNVYYFGNPRVSYNISGSGKVINEN